MSETHTIDRERLTAMLTELRLPTIKHLWASFTTQVWHGPFTTLVEAQQQQRSMAVRERRECRCVGRE